MQTSAICHKRIAPWVAVLLLFSPLLHAQSLSESIRLGGRSGWDHLQLRENVMMLDGWQGGADLGLADWGATVDPDTDLLASFDFGVDDQTGRYRGSGTGVRILSTERRFGAAAAAFDGESVLTYHAGPDALLSPDTQPGAFTIDLWLYPLRVTEGATVLRWRGALINSGSPVLQELRLEIRDNGMVWTLNNLIVRAHADGARTFSSQRVAARRGLVPRRWSHHQLRYDGRTGQLSYRVDGVPEAITYLTDDGREGAAAAGIYFGADTGDGLVLGERFRGFVDELRITRDADRAPRPVSYSGEPGRAYTEALYLGESGAHVEGIDVRTQTPGRTAVRSWYRVADLVVSNAARDALPTDWHPVPADGVLPMDARGRFLQLRFDLLADAAGRQSPRVQEVVVSYRPEMPPPAPRGLSGASVEEGVQLSWDPVRTTDIAGYRVYIGERPGRYLGTDGVTSPIDVGTDTGVVIDGLRPDRAYVFSVESYDRYGESSGLAAEIQVRAGGNQP